MERRPARREPTIPPRDRNAVGDERAGIPLAAARPARFVVPAIPMSDDFGSRLRGLRESRRLSLRRLARLVAISPSCLSRIERGQMPPPADPTIARIAGALAADAEGLFEAAGRLPADVRALVLRRPRLMARLVRAADALSDDRLEAFCGQVARAASETGAGPVHGRRREAL